MSELRVARKYFILVPLIMSLFGLLFLALLKGTPESAFFLPLIVPIVMLQEGLRWPYVAFLFMATWGLKFLSPTMRVVFAALNNAVVLAVVFIIYRQLHGQMVPWPYGGHCRPLVCFVLAFMPEVKSALFICGLATFALLQGGIFYKSVYLPRNRSTSA